MKQTNNELKNTTYEIFMGLLSVLSIVNLVLLYVIKSEDIAMVVGIMDAVLTVIFLSDFLFRFFTADSKRTYFLKQYGWADLLASMPFPQLKLLRTFRIIRVVRLLYDLGPKGIVDEFVKNRARSALLTLLLLVILLIEFGSLAILSVEHHNPNAPIQTASDAVWFTFVTITTVGYGDMYPVTQLGRMIGIAIMSVGVALFGTLTGYLSHQFIGSSGEGPIEAALTNHTNGNTAPRTSEPADPADLDVSTKERITELKRLLTEQQQNQALLAQKLNELETLL